VPLLVTIEEADPCFIQVYQQQVRGSHPSTEPRNPIPDRDCLVSSTKNWKNRDTVLWTGKEVMKMVLSVVAQQTGTQKRP
jgi:hypothetical protein